MFRRICALLLTAIPLSLSLGAPPRPPEPETYHVWLRYHIFAYRTERLRQYDEMIKAFKAAGFVRDPDEVIAADEPDNPKATRMKGTVPAAQVPKLMRQRHVQSLLLYPKNTELPEEKGSRVRVELELASGYLQATQRQLARQTIEVLSKDLGFVEAVAYDHQGERRLVGSVPVENLEKLVEDVRHLPTAQGAAAPLRNISPVRVTLVRPDWPVPAGKLPTAAVPENLRKFTPEMRALLASNEAEKSRRLEVILGWTPQRNDQDWQSVLEGTGAIVEGRIGPLVTVLASPKTVAGKLAALPEVAHVRIPRTATGRTPADEPVPAKWEPLRPSGLAKLHAMGQRGKGTRVALIAEDFAGWEKLKGRREGKWALPDPILVDLTAERNRNLLPDPYPEGKANGFGTRCAESLLRASPEAELVLLRVDAEAPYMVQTLAQAMNGETVRTLCLTQRSLEIRGDREVLDRRAEQLRREREVLFDTFSGDDEGRKRLQDYRDRQAQHDREEEAWKQRRDRFYRLLQGLRQLRGVRLVACTLVWTEGFPVDGSSALSRYFDDLPFRSALWFQAAGDSGGQVWTGPFRDQDENGVLEFCPAHEKLPSRVWSRELNFLRWESANGGQTAALPAGATVRLSLQWREAHDPRPLRAGDDVYREPLSKFEVVVVYQPDPEGKSRPADDVETVLRSPGPATRLQQNLNSATYEQVVELRVTRPGRYAVFVEGKQAESIQAPGEARLPATTTRGEVTPRLLVRTLAGNGRAVWADFASKQAALGMPADAQRVIAVGAAGADHRARDSSANGAPAGLSLLKKPEVLAYDSGGGTAEAASFAAGFAATAWPVGGTIYGVLERMQVPAGGLLRVPEKRVGREGP